MKILSVTVIPPGDDAQWWRISKMAKILEDNGCTVDIVHYIIKGSKSHRKLKSTGINENTKDSFIIMNLIVVPFKHIRRVFAGRYDLVYGNNLAGAFFSIFGKFTSIPIIYDMHGIPEEVLLGTNLKSTSLRFNLMKLANYLALNFSDKVLCVSKNMVNYLHNEKKIPLSKLEYVTNGVDLDIFSQSSEDKKVALKEKLGLKNKFIFGYIGNMQKWQGIDNFLEAATKVKTKNVTFLIIGGDKDSKENNIVYIPKVNRSEIPEYYSICDVLVLPRPSHIGTEVAAPTKFAEYTAMGKPILTTNVGDAAEFVKSYKNGIVVENNDPESIKEGILQFLSLDILKLHEMGKNSRKLAENEFDWKKISNKLITIQGDFD